MNDRKLELDCLIYSDVKDIEPGDNFFLTYAEKGFSEAQVEARLKELAAQGLITIIQSVGRTTVSGITKHGRAFFESRLLA